MSNDTILLQKQIMENSKSINEYFKDLFDWEKEICKRDQIVKGESSKNPIQINKNLIKIEEENSNNEKEKENSNNEKSQKEEGNETDNKPVKLKRDVNSIKDYYREWDKFKVDSDEEKSDTEKDKSSKPKDYTKSFKTSEAKPNSNIKIFNRRLINLNTNNPEFFTNEENLFQNEFDRFINLDFEYISRMRSEANTFFAIANFNKSIELNSTVIKLIETKKKLFVDLLEKKNFEKTQKNLAENKPENSGLITEFDFCKSKTFEILTNCYNNRGNSYLRNNNFKEAINDFNLVLKRDARNVKALFRRAVAYFNLQVYNSSLRDLNAALALSGNEAEKTSIKAQIEKTINEINSLVKKVRSKSEKYEISHEAAFRRAIVKDIDEDLVEGVKEFNDAIGKEENKDEEILKQKNDLINIKLINTFNACGFFKDLESLNTNNDERIYAQNGSKHEKIESKKTDTDKSQEISANNNSYNTNQSKSINNINYKNIQTATINKEELLKFVYDISFQNQTASSFKYALRNLKNDQKEKEEYILKINPNYIPNIFKHDIDKDTLVDIFTCLKGIINRSKLCDLQNKESSDQYNIYNIFAIDVLKNLLKINRFKLVMRLLSKKDKSLVEDIFDSFDKDWDSELISIRDLYSNLK